MSIRVYSNKDEDYYKSIDQLIAQYKPGGLTFFQGGPYRQVILTNRWQRLSQTPMLISMDADAWCSMQ